MAFKLLAIIVLWLLVINQYLILIHGIIIIATHIKSSCKKVQFDVIQSRVGIDIIMYYPSNHSKH